MDSYVKAATWIILETEPVKKGPTPECPTIYSLEDQIKRPFDGKRVPTAAELAYAVLVYFKMTGIRLFPNCPVYTSSSYRVHHTVNYHIHNTVDYHIRMINTDKLLSISSAPLDRADGGAAVNVWKAIPRSPES